MDSILLRSLLGCDVALLEDEPLDKHTGFQTGGKTRFMVVPSTIAALSNTVTILRKSDICYYILGQGKNVLALDVGYDGVVILTTSLNKIKIKDNTIFCEAGVSLHDLCTFAKDNSLTGLEFAYGIPGTVGGALYMNAGAYDGEMKDVVKKVTVLSKSGECTTLLGEECDFSYRNSRFQKSAEMILSAQLLLTPGDKSLIEAKMRTTLQKRLEKQPLNFPSCGSAFKRPRDAFASKLIDDCGLKGTRVGGASVSEKHAGFIVNDRKATSSDILDLITLVRTCVKKETGYDLQPEIEILR